MDSSNKQNVLHEDWMSFIEERLAAGQTVRYVKFRGVSMRPMLRQGKDAVEIAPLPKQLKKYDLPVYKRSDGQYVMHRVIAVKKDRYICLGDNTITLENIYPEQMIGVVSAFRRGEKRMEVTNLGYQLYCRIWVVLAPIRIVCVKMKHKMCSLVKVFKRVIKDET